MTRAFHPGILSAVAAALLFGAATPLAKLLLGEISPWLLAGLFYLGSGIGLTVYRYFISAPTVHLAPREWSWFAAAITSGGVIAPVLLMLGLTQVSASSASLLLNAEAVFTTLLAWFVFKENFDRRIVLGMVAIVAGAVLLSWPQEIHAAEIWPSLAVLAACLAWGLDNNLTRKVSHADATWIASIKGLIAGTVNVSVSLGMGVALPSLPALAQSMTIGLFSYGVSLALFVVGLRHLGTARTGAYFSVAPFFGAIMALVLGETLTLTLTLAGVLMAIGVWLHVTEQHTHEHTHDGLDDAHQPSNRSTTHTHAHYPDVHHQHRH